MAERVTHVMYGETVIVTMPRRIEGMCATPDGAYAALTIDAHTVLLTVEQMDGVITALTAARDQARKILG